MAGRSTRGLICLLIHLFRAGSPWVLKRALYCMSGVALLVLVPPGAWPEQLLPPPLTPQNIPGSSSRGESLFAGRIQFHNRGPACISCHSIGGLPFPNGGTLGPDLTNAYTLLGQPGAQAAIHTLYFGVMTPIYDQHPLTSEEQADLLAFLKQSQTANQPQWITQTVIFAAIVLAGILLLITAIVWRRRLISVRGALVDRVRKQGAL